MHRGIDDVWAWMMSPKKRPQPASKRWKCCQLASAAWLGLGDGDYILHSSGEHRRLNSWLFESYFLKLKCVGHVGIVLRDSSCERTSLTNQLTTVPSLTGQHGFYLL